MSLEIPPLLASLPGCAHVRKFRPCGAKDEPACYPARQTVPGETTNPFPASSAQAQRGLWKLPKTSFPPNPGRANQEGRTSPDPPCREHPIWRAPSRSTAQIEPSRALRPPAVQGKRPVSSAPRGHQSSAPRWSPLPAGRGAACVPERAASRPPTPPLLCPSIFSRGEGAQQGLPYGPLPQVRYSMTRRSPEHSRHVLAPWTGRVLLILGDYSHHSRSADARVRVSEPTARSPPSDCPRNRWTAGGGECELSLWKKSGRAG